MYDCTENGSPMRATEITLCLMVSRSCLNIPSKPKNLDENR